MKESSDSFKRIEPTVFVIRIQLIIICGNNNDAIAPRYTVKERTDPPPPKKEFHKVHL